MKNRKGEFLVILTILIVIFLSFHSDNNLAGGYSRTNEIYNSDVSRFDIEDTDGLKCNMFYFIDKPMEICYYEHSRELNEKQITFLNAIRGI